MTDAPTSASSTFTEEMQAGNTQRQLGNHQAAVQHFLLAESEAMSSSQLATARQAAGVSYRILADLPNATTLLTRALTTATIAHKQDHRLLGAIERDLAEVYHDEALGLLKQGSFEGAARAFDEADVHYSRSMSLLEGIGDAGEAFATQGFRGMMWYDRGLRKEGRAEIKRAVLGFRALRFPHAVYETNNLIRYMRVSFIGRWTSLPRALELTSKQSKSPGRRMEVIGALGGNTIYLRLKRRKQGK